MDENWLSRTEMLLGEESLNKLKNATVAVIGCGGIGSYTLDALVRTGIGNIVLFDKALIDVTNLNRNLMADTKVVGKYKVDIAKKRLLNINPNLNIKIVKEYINKDTASRLISNDFNYIVDTIDSISDKIALITEATRKNIPIISSMGTSDKFDPTLFEITDISKTKSCPFANLLKNELKAKGIEHLKVIYSQEKPTRFRSTESDYRAQMSSISFVPSVAGLIICSEVVKDLID
ncbi:MAG: tRNA threonylcarbamoyladenosine dehydratase [Clostridia bacterium]|nr:tRNA threonylcarbamoyladenosine dehydratase [Clostridia bacterium]